MKREFDASPAFAHSQEHIALSLAQLEGSAAFRSAPRHRAMLRYMIERALAGDLAALKETVIAVEVFGRPAARFDPKVDSIVRVEARRLRGRLDAYYRGEGRDAVLRIELPVGSYIPSIAAREPRVAPDEATRRAADLVTRGEHFLREALSRQTLETALERFDDALRAAPPTARAFVGMARAWLNLATGWHHAPTIATGHAAEALRQALALEPDHAVAHALLGAVQNQYERDWPAARRSFRRALTLAPKDAFVHSAYGCHLFMRGHDEEAEHELLLAREIDPLYVNSRAHLVNLRIRQGRFDEAQAEIDAMLDIAPDSLSAHGLAGLLALGRGDNERAVAIYTRLCELQPQHPGCLASLAGAHAAAGRVAQADALLADLHERLGEHIVSPYVMAIVATHSQRPDLAFELLRQADETRDPNALFSPADPSFADLHGDARWPALVARVIGRAPRRRRDGS
jgi:Tfp pilus assembly protein PilF